MITVDTSDASFTVCSPDGKIQIYPSYRPSYGLIRNGYMIFDSAASVYEQNDNSRFAHWFYNPETKRYDVFLKEDKIMDLFFIYGPDYEKLYSGFNQLTGPVPLLHKKLYGFMQTRHHGDKGSQESLLALASKLREHHIPCDTLILDYEWGDGCEGDKNIPWGSGLQWSPKYTAPLSPKEMITRLKELHYELILISHGVPNYPHKDDIPSALPPGYTGYNHEPEKYWNALKEKLDIGVMGVWQDNRQNDICQGQIYAGMQDYLGEEKRATLIQCREMYNNEPWDSHYKPIPLTKLIGSHRYPFDWTGDCDNNWSELEYQIKAIINEQGPLKGVSYITADAFSKNYKVQARWNQFMSFNSVARSHTQEPWQPDYFIDPAKFNFNETEREDSSGSQHNGSESAEKSAENSIRKYLTLRYKLIPYLYSYAFEHYKTGFPICRPLMIAFPKDKRCYKNQWKTEYMFGKDILIAPVYQDFMNMEIYLPEKEKWIDFWDGTVYEGGQVLDYDTTDYEKMPIFIRSGAIIPMQESCEWIDAEENNNFDIHLYPDSANTMALYCDDGTSLKYQHGIYNLTEITCEKSENGIDIEVQPIKREYKAEETEVYTFYLHGVEDSESVKSDNCTVLEKEYQSDTQLLILKCSFRRGEKVQLSLRLK